MGPVTPRLLAGFGAVLLVAVLAHGVEPEMATMVVGLAKCADCSRKNMNAEAAFNGTLTADLHATSNHLHFCWETCVSRILWRKIT